MDQPGRSVVDNGALPPNYPTHSHAPKFWEALGRTVAIFGFLEEVLGKAIFAFTGMREVSDADVSAAYDKWKVTLKHALSDALGSLIISYEKAVKEYGSIGTENFDHLIKHLKQAKELRNVVCHGSWNMKPDPAGYSIPFFVDNKGRIFNTPVDVSYLQCLQREAMELTCEVINTVTVMGWQFPGSDSPGTPISPVKPAL